MRGFLMKCWLLLAAFSRHGDVGANGWVEPNGDVLFYISKVDAYQLSHRASVRSVQPWIINLRQIG